MNHTYSVLKSAFLITQVRRENASIYKIFYDVGPKMVRSNITKSPVLNPLVAVYQIGK